MLESWLNAIAREGIEQEQIPLSVISAARSVTELAYETSSSEHTTRPAVLSESEEERKVQS